MKVILSILFITLIGSSGYAQDPDAGESTQYVTVSSSNPDAVVMDGTDFFEAEPICMLIQNQSVTMLDSTDGEYVMIRFLCDGKTVEGWVKKIILAPKPLENKPRVTESGSTGSGVAIGGSASIAPGLPDMDPGIEAKGTGQTTGHIANLLVTNNDSVPIVTVAQTVYIPSGGQYQPYIGRIPEGVIIPPNGTVTIPLPGYCADPHVPPVSNGADFPSPGENWIPVGEPQVPSGSDDGVPVILINTDPVPSFTPATIPAITSTPAFTPSNKPDGDIVITWPGTDSPVGGTLNPETNPRHYAQVIVDVLERLEDAVVIIQEDEQYDTPFSPDPVKEREAIIQQTLWIFCASITGEPYVEEDFEKNVYGQLEERTGKTVASLPTEQKEELDSGIAGFWNVFQATGIEAKVIEAEPEPEELQPPVEISEDVGGCAGDINLTMSPPYEVDMKITSEWGNAEERQAAIQTVHDALAQDVEITADGAFQSYDINRHPTSSTAFWKAGNVGGFASA
ncbi:MAG TPA: hypothetical protein VI603_04900, partial [Saprospiraceae bacterium]|nr:hypothetical protein [Saprospiraceae bacterium]